MNVCELCPICQDDGSECAWCDGVGLVEHDCDASLVPPKNGKSTLAAGRLLT